MGEKELQALLQESLSVATKTDAIEPADLVLKHPDAGAPLRCVKPPVDWVIAHFQRPIVECLRIVGFPVRSIALGRDEPMVGPRGPSAGVRKHNP